MVNVDENIIHLLGYNLFDDYQLHKKNWLLFYVFICTKIFRKFIYNPYKRKVMHLANKTLIYHELPKNLDIV